jgi:hypothetical protein
MASSKRRISPVFGDLLRPYWMMRDLATVFAFGYALVFSVHFPSASLGGLVLQLLFRCST